MTNEPVHCSKPDSAGAPQLKRASLFWTSISELGQALRFCLAPPEQGRPLCSIASPVWPSRILGGSLLASASCLTPRHAPIFRQPSATWDTSFRVLHCFPI